MKEAEFPFDEPWPADETKSVVDAVRSAVAASRQHRWGDSRSADRAAAGSVGDAGVIESSLGEAGRQWAVAHQSASLMRTRLDALEASMDAELDTGTEAERSAALRAWRTVTDAATLTSLNQLEQAALVDPLTGVGNRRALDLMLTRAISGARRAGSGLVVVAVDLDGLKRINDSQGHAEGDRTLTSLVDAVGNRLRASDAVFRTGGDEFAVVLPGTALGDIDPLMQRVSSGDTPQFTWGAAELTAEHQSPSELLDAADTDLYRHRGMEREMAAAVAAGAGAVVTDLRRSRGSLRLRVSRRVSVAAAAGLVAIGGTLATVATLSPGTQTALPLKNGVRSPAATDAPHRLGASSTTLPAATPGPAAASPAAPTTPPAASAGTSPAASTTGGTAITAATSPIAQLTAAVTAGTTSNPTAVTAGSTTPNPRPTPPAASSPTQPANPSPTTTVPAAAATPVRGKSGNSLPSQAAAAQAAAAQAAAARAAAASPSAKLVGQAVVEPAAVPPGGGVTLPVQAAAAQAAETPRAAVPTQVAGGHGSESARAADHSSSRRR